MSFTSALQNTLSDVKSVTENGAIGYATTGKFLVDMFFNVSSYRNLSDGDIAKDFAKVYAENPELAVKFAFYVGDIREGLGERRMFKVMIKWYHFIFTIWITTHTTKKSHITITSTKSFI